MTLFEYAARAQSRPFRSEFAELSNLGDQKQSHLLHLVIFQYYQSYPKIPLKSSRRTYSDKLING